MTRLVKISDMNSLSLVARLGNAFVWKNLRRRKVQIYQNSGIPSMLIFSRYGQSCTSRVSQWRDVVRTREASCADAAGIATVMGLSLLRLYK